jgi:uncharacterized protein (DUF4415 family)
MNAKSKNISNSSWIDSDDAPELTEDDFAKGQWFKANTPINAQEGKNFFRQMLENSVNTPLDYDIVEYFKTKSNGDSYIKRINNILRQAIEQEKNLNSPIS